MRVNDKSSSQLLQCSIAEIDLSIIIIITSVEGHL